MRQRTSLDDRVAAQVAELFSALGDSSRVRIIWTLADGEMNVGALAEAIGISESAVSHHMRILRQLRLVRSERRGREVFYSLDDDHVTDLFLQAVDHVRHA